MADKPSKIWPWLTFGAGVLVAGAGGIVHYMAYGAEMDADEEAKTAYYSALEQGLSDKEAEKKKNETYDEMFDDKVKPKETAAWVMYGVGAAAVVGGLVWYVLLPNDATSTGTSKTTFAPVLSPDTTGFQLQWTF